MIVRKGALSHVYIFKLCPTTLPFCDPVNGPQEFPCASQKKPVKAPSTKYQISLVKQLASLPDMGLQLKDCQHSSGLAVQLATESATGTTNSTNIAHCLSHLFLFLEFLWKFSYEIDQRR